MPLYTSRTIINEYRQFGVSKLVRQYSQVTPAGKRRRTKRCGVSIHNLLDFRRQIIWTAAKTGVF